MKNRVLKLVALMSIAGSSALLATTELRTPLSLVRDFGPFHYPLDPVDDDCLNWDIFGALYYRRADRGFADTDKFSSRDTVSLAQLFFGRESFVGVDSFAMLPNTPCPVVLGNPFMSFATINPVFHYTEKGAVFGGRIDYRFDDCSCWRIGGRAALPFKMIRVDRDLACAPFEEGLEDVVLDVQQRIDPTIPVPAGTNLTGVAGTPTVGLTPALTANVLVNNPNGNVRGVYAYRLDFLTALRFPGTTNSIVNYRNPGSGNHITIAGRDVTTIPLPVAQTLQAFFPAMSGVSTAGIYSFTLPFQQAATRHVYALKSTDGTLTNPGVLAAITLPNGELSIARDVAPAALLNNAGTNGANGDRLAFDSAADYTALQNNCAAQRQLFIIPNSRGTGELLPDAAAIKQTVDFIIKSSTASLGTASASGFFQTQGINLCDNQRVNGIGDFDTDVYVGYDYSDCLYGELALGVRWPTGKKLKNPGLVYYQTTGNNGHFELKAQLDLGWKPCNWFGLHTDLSYSHAFSRTEKKAAAFQGALVRNIGPTVDAKVSYGYVIWHVDATFFHPENCNLGFVLSYELYAKRKDKVEFETAMARDLNGVLQPLDATILERNTNAVSNKIRGEFFHRWDYCELFIGASRVFAGRNVFKETEAHIGMGISF